MADYRRILVPTDFTDTSERALDWAFALAARLGSAITIMHSYEIPITGFPEGALVATADIAIRIGEASRDGLERVVAKRLDATRAGGAGADHATSANAVTVDSVLREGVAWEEINRVADEIDADIIVMGTHGRKGLARALLGSVADNVVRTATRPVVTIRGAK